MKSLKVEIFSDLVLDHPVGVGSSHLTGNEKSLDFVIRQKPSFLTIKSTSNSYGGEGKGVRLLQKLYLMGMPFSFASDGPRSLELLTTKRTLQLIQFVRSKDTNIALGVSLLHDENFENDLKLFEHV